MRSSTYIQILQDILLDLLDDLPLNVRTNAVFQQDNARVHTTVRVAAFFRRKPRRCGELVGIQPRFECHRKHLEDIESGSAKVPTSDIV